MKLSALQLLLAATALSTAGCHQTESPTTEAINSSISLTNQSVNPSLVKSLSGFENLQITTLISSDDKLAQSPDFVFGGQPDGAGLLKDPTGDGYVLINNHEYMQSVSRVYLDKTFRPVKGEYIVDYEGGTWRLCSASMATPAEHGFGPVFLTAGESGAESMVHAINPLGTADKKNRDRVLPALGRASMENAVPLPKTAYSGKTVVILGEDNGDGQLLAYVSTTVGDLQNGKLYFLRRTNQEAVETNMVQGQSYDVEFVEVTDAKTQTGSQIAAQSVEKKAIQFARVEDIDYRKDGQGRDVFFTATGQSQSDRLTPIAGKTMWGRVYRLQMDATDPLKGKLSIIADGGVDPGNNIVNPDNLCATKDYVYIQEDGDSFYVNNKHDGRIWQYSLATGQLKPMLEMNHRRDDATFNAKYNSIASPLLSSWEYGAMYDVSDIIGVPNSFIVNLHPHTWRDMKYNNADGSSGSKAASISASNGSFTEGGQVVLIRGVQK